MNKFHVLFAGIVGIVILMSIALLKGMNGALLASAFTAIGALVGFAFGFIGTSPGKPGETASGSARKFLALLAAAGLALGGCSREEIREALEYIPEVEICVYSKPYGKICGSLVNGQVKISADVDLPPELRTEIEERIRQLGAAK